MKPILKWAGGKNGLIKDIQQYFPSNMTERNYHEPFVGGGAVFFYLEPHQGTINDANERLMTFYKMVKTNKDELITEAEKLQPFISDPDEYYTLRKEFNSADLDDVRKAALFTYFNKAAYNGLYRENSKGGFNVPIGKHNNPKVIDRQKIEKAHKLLQNVTLYNEDFYYVSSKVVDGDFCYLDPPYYQSDKKNKFTDYTKNGFSFEDHKRVKELCVELDKKGVYFLLSNSNAPEIVDLYKSEGFVPEFVTKKWMISCNASTRKNVKEIIVHNSSSFS